MKQSRKQPRTTAPTAVDRRAVVSSMCEKPAFSGLRAQTCSIDLEFLILCGPSRLQKVTSGANPLSISPVPKRLSRESR
jgi:hypothetical protein